MRRQSDVAIVEDSDEETAGDERRDPSWRPGDKLLPESVDQQQPSLGSCITMDFVGQCDVTVTVTTPRPPGVGAWHELVGRRDADRTRDAGRVDRAVPVRDLVEVLLVIILGEVELFGRDDLGRDVAVSGRA
jgi:hypothetical protein